MVAQLETTPSSRKRKATALVAHQTVLHELESKILVAEVATAKANKKIRACEKVAKDAEIRAERLLAQHTKLQAKMRAGQTSEASWKRKQKALKQEYSKKEAEWKRVQKVKESKWKGEHKAKEADWQATKADLQAQLGVALNRTPVSASTAVSASTDYLVKSFFALSKDNRDERKDIRTMQTSVDLARVNAMRPHSAAGFCSGCGRARERTGGFCSQCGAPQ